MDKQEEWQKDSLDEAKRIIQKSQRDFTELKRMSNISSTGFCQVGGHRTPDALYFCNQCKRSFCEKHGNKEKLICDDCQEANMGLD